MKNKINDYIKKVKEKQINEGSEDYIDHEELFMVMGDLRKINDLSAKLYYMLKKDPSCLEEWNQIKISKATDYMSSVYDYLTYTNVNDNE